MLYSEKMRRGKIIFLAMISIFLNVVECDDRDRDRADRKSSHTVTYKEINDNVDSTPHIITGGSIMYDDDANENENESDMKLYLNNYKEVGQMYRKKGKSKKHNKKDKGRKGNRASVYEYYYYRKTYQHSDDYYYFDDYIHSHNHEHNIKHDHEHKHSSDMNIEPVQGNLGNSFGMNPADECKSVEIAYEYENQPHTFYTPGCFKQQTMLDNCQTITVPMNGELVVFNTPECYQGGYHGNVGGSGFFFPTPSKRPSRMPSARPSSKPSLKPSSKPSRRPSRRPSKSPSHSPTNRPTSIDEVPTTPNPTSRPTINPTGRPSISPSSKPSIKPSSIPSLTPSITPTTGPTLIPTTLPTTMPSEQPVVPIQPFNTPLAIGIGIPVTVVVIGIVLYIVVIECGGGITYGGGAALSKIKNHMINGFTF